MHNKANIKFQYPHYTSKLFILILSFIYSYLKTSMLTHYHYNPEIYSEENVNILPSIMCENHSLKNSFLMRKYKHPDAITAVAGSVNHPRCPGPTPWTAKPVPLAAAARPAKGTPPWPPGRLGWWHDHCAQWGVGRSPRQSEPGPRWHCGACLLHFGFKLPQNTI